MTTTTETEIRTEWVWTGAAWDEFTNIKNHAHAIRAHWGMEMGDRAASSLLHCLTSIMASGPTRIYRDGPLSLLIVTDYITMGMIFHRDTSKRIVDQLGHRSITTDEIDKLFEGPRPAPHPGEWSLHS